MIGGIVLAAGLSERMEGGPKQLLAFGDRTMVGLVVATVEATSLPRSPSSSATELVRSKQPWRRCGRQSLTTRGTRRATWVR